MCCISCDLILREIKTSRSRYTFRLHLLQVKKNAFPTKEPAEVLYVLQEQRSRHLSADGGIPNEKPWNHYKVGDPQVCPEAPL